MKTVCWIAAFLAVSSSLASAQAPATWPVTVDFSGPTIQASHVDRYDSQGMQYTQGSGWNIAPGGSFTLEFSGGTETPALQFVLVAQAQGCFMNVAIKRPASITLNGHEIYVAWTSNININNRCVSAHYGSPATLPTGSVQSGLNIVQITSDAGYSSYVISSIQISPP